VDRQDVGGTCCCVSAEGECDVHRHREVGGRVAAGRGRRARRLAIDTAGCDRGWKRGDSVAVSGVCLTLVAVADGRFEAEISGETTRRTTLGRLAAATRSTRAGLARADALGGHLVTGHVTASRASAIAARRAARSARRSRRRARSRASSRRKARSRSTASASRSTASPAGNSASTSCRTRARDDARELAPGRALNLEVDLVARYLDRLLEARGNR
jgi:riboflavin synthase